MIIDDVKSILVVDDEEDLREILRFELEDQGYCVLEAKGVDDALSKLSQNHVDIIAISDIRMPEKSGVELLRKLREKHYCAPPLIFMSGFADISTSKAFDSGAAGVFSKPHRYVCPFKSRKNLTSTCNGTLEKRSDWSNTPKYFDNISFENLNEAEDKQNLLIGHGGIFIKCSPEDFN